MNNYSVYPGHGPVKFIKKEEKTMGGSSHTFYFFETVSNRMKICIPEKELGKLVRPLTSKEEAAEITRYLSDGNSPKINTQTWNRRYRESMEKIKEGTLREIATVIKELNHIETIKELSFGEKKMKEFALSLFNSEMELIQRG